MPVASTGLLGLRERPVQIARAATAAGFLHNANPWIDAARRVSVVGTSGSGKSTLALALARLLGAPFLELDSVYHQADWVPLPTEEYRARVALAVEGERWVIDGNYSTVQDIVWARADTVVFLDLPRRMPRTG